MKTTSVVIGIAAIAIFSALFLGRAKGVVAAAPAAESVDASGSENALEHKIVAKEREGLGALRAGKVELFADLTAEEAVFVDAQGPASKAQVLTNANGFTLSDYSMENVRFVPLSGKSGLITYKISEKGNSHGRDFAAQAYVSSIWAQRGNKWVCLFSQETLAK